MKTCSNKFKLMFLSVVALVLTMDMQLTPQPVSAEATCNVTVVMPAELADAGAKVTIYPWNSYYKSGECFTKNIGDTVSWRLVVNGMTGQTWSKKIDCTPLVVDSQHYCNMKISMPLELAYAGAQVNVYPWNTYWTHNQEVLLPIGATIKWRLKVNGRTGKEYIKTVDCTPLAVGNDTYCNMEIQAPAGVIVEFYPWNERYANGDRVLLPIGATITWRFKGQSQTYNKSVDCTPLVAGPINRPPVASDQSVTTNEDTPVPITLIASDPDGDRLTYSYTLPLSGSLSGTAPNLIYTPNANFNGSDSFTFKANDGTVDSNMATVTITVNPVNDYPVANAGIDQTVESTSPQGAKVTLDASGSFDPDGDLITYKWTAPGIVFDDPTSQTPSGIFPLGTTTVTLVVNDGYVDSEPDTVAITVRDTTPPTISVLVTPDTLWPPNHKMVKIVATVTVNDNCDVAPRVVLTSVVSNEPDDAPGDGDGNTINDIQGAEIGTEDYVFHLRAERAGSGNGRVYTVTYTAIDASDNSASASATVVVPHEQPKKGR